MAHVNIVDSSVGQIPQSMPDTCRNQETVLESSTWSVPQIYEGFLNDYGMPRKCFEEFLHKPQDSFYTHVRQYRIS